MRKLMILAAAVLLPSAASAQLTFGLRVGYAVVGGDAVKDGPMNEVIDGAIPVQLDLGYAVSPAITVGGYFGYGFGRLNSDISDGCDALDLDCSASVTRVGVQGDYSFLGVSPSLVPWAGIGVGYEWAELEIEDETDTFSGFELDLQGGLDLQVSRHLRVGGFLSFGLGQFSKETLDPDPDGVSGSIDDKGIHGYFTIGLRGQFGL
jgi:hypothetical protein